MLNVTFLAHSGFLVDDGKRCYVFDYYKDLYQMLDLYEGNKFRIQMFYFSFAHDKIKGIKTA